MPTAPYEVHVNLRGWPGRTRIPTCEDTLTVHGNAVPFGTDRLFGAADAEGLVLGVEICEDLWVPIPPSSSQALAGATLLVNLSASNEVIGKASYRRQLVASQSGRCIAGGGSHGAIAA